MQTKSRNSNKTAILEKQQERETWYKLVVKIISWKSGLLEGGTVKQVNKISAREWRTYCEHSLRINVTYGKSKTQEDLKELKKIIHDFGGFE